MVSSTAHTLATAADTAMPTSTPTLILFCTTNGAAPAALVGSLAEAGVRLVVRPQPLAEADAPSADVVQRLRAEIQTNAPTAVLATDPWPLAMAALTAALQMQCPFLVRLDDALDVTQAGEAALDRYATIAQAADCVLLNSAAQHRILTAQGVEPGKLHLAAELQVQVDTVLAFLRSR